MGTSEVLQGGLSASSFELSLDGAIDRGPGDVEKLAEFCCGMQAGGVQLQQMSLLGVGQFRLFSAKAPLGLGDLHAFTCSGAN